jgi:Mg/Co/Ni transporter MgtE
MINSDTIKVKELINSGKIDNAIEILKNHSPREIAEIIDPLDAEQKRELFNRLDVLLAADVMIELNDLSKYEILKEIKDKKFEEIVHKIRVTGEIFVSDVLNDVVYDAGGEDAGRLKDFVISSGELFPQVEAIVINTKQGISIVPWNLVNIFNKRVIGILKFKDELEQFNYSSHMVLMCRDLLDRQIVDINGARVVRINDLKLGEIKGKLHLLAADVGTRGLLRRLRLEGMADRLGIKLSSKLIPWNLFQPLEPNLNKLTLSATKQLLSRLHPADIAQMLQQLPDKERLVLISALTPKLSAEVISELKPEIQANILEQIGIEKASGILKHLPPDEATDLIGDLPGEKAKKMLEFMSEKDVQAVESLLSHKEDTAGGLMTTEFVSLNQELTVGEAIDKLREIAKEVETIYYVYITEENGKLIGVLSLRDIIMSDPTIKLKDLMVTQLKVVKPDTHYRDVGELLATYNLIAAPVVDDAGVLVGIVTVDDILEISFPSGMKK